MDSFELNKIAGAVLAALLIIVGTSEIMALTGFSGGDHGADHAKGGFELPAPVMAAASPTAAPAAPAGFNAKAVLAMVATGKPDAGKASFKKCKACHTTEKGGANRVGPNLWGIIGRGKSATAGFKYSAAMKGLGGAWGYQDLVQFLHKPKKFVPGTKMSFGGVKGDKELADLVAFLRTLSDAPAPLPQ